MKIPQIIEVDLGEFYFSSLKRIVKAYEEHDMEGAEREIINFRDIYEAFIGELSVEDYN